MFIYFLVQISKFGIYALASSPLSPFPPSLCLSSRSLPVLVFNNTVVMPP